MGKVENCHATVKTILPVAGFLVHFAHFSSQYNLMLIWGLLQTCLIDPRCSMLETLEIQKKSRKLSVEHTLRKQQLLKFSGF